MIKYVLCYTNKIMCVYVSVRNENYLSHIT